MLETNTEKRKSFYRWSGMGAIAFLAVVMYGIPYISSGYYYPMMETMGISHTQMGTLLSVYGLGCMISYIPGGIIGDKFRTKKVMVISQTCTALLGLLYAFTMSYSIALIVWFLLAFSSCFAIWSAIGKARRMLVGTEDLGGFRYGLIYFGQSFLGFAMSALFLWVFAASSDQSQGFFWTVVAMSIAQVVAAVLILIFFKEDEFDPVKEDEADKFHVKDTIIVLKDPIVWLLSLICLATYAIACGQYYFTPYLTDIYGVATVETAGLNIVRTYLFLLLSPVGGIILDKYVKSMAKMYIYICSGLALSFVVMILLPEGVSPWGATLATMLPAFVRGIVAGLADTIFNEAKTPMKYTGTAYVVSSLICYTPDLFIYILFGWFLDTMPGKAGYNAIFITLVGFAIFGIIAAIILVKAIRKRLKKLEELGLKEGIV